MWGSARSLLVVVVLALSTASSAHGWFRPRYVAYYYPAPVAWAPPYRVVVAPAPVYAPAPAVYCPPAVPALQAIPAPYAQPTPAGPSSAPARPPGGAEPPRGAEPPKISEAHSFYNSYAVVSSTSEKPGNGRCQVGFWNLTDRDVKLTVAGQALVLARGQQLKLDLERQFVWRMENRDPQTERVPATEAGVEIVIRR